MSNPKLNELKTQILECLEKEENSRVLVFVKTINLTESLLEWMKETPELRGYNPLRFVGAVKGG